MSAAEGSIASAPPDRAHVEQLLGAWRTVGVIVGGGGRVEAEFRGIDRFEMLGDAIIVHRSDAEMPDGPVHQLEVIGPWEPRSGRFPVCIWDGEGDVEQATATVGRDGAWRFESPGGTARCVLRRIDDARLSSDWERSDDEGRTWRPWMRLQLVRTDVSAGCLPPHRRHAPD